jgi:hypothetical protein
VGEAGIGSHASTKLASGTPDALAISMQMRTNVAGRPPSNVRAIFWR